MANKNLKELLSLSKEERMTYLQKYIIEKDIDDPQRVVYRVTVADILGVLLPKIEAGEVEFKDEVLGDMITSVDEDMCLDYVTEIEAIIACSDYLRN